MTRDEYLSQQRLGDLVPFGRWHRILALLSSGAFTLVQIIDRTNPGKHPRWQERKKIRAALRDLGALGWIQRVEAWGWTISSAGRAEVDALPPVAVRTREPAE